MRAGAALASLLAAAAILAACGGGGDDDAAAPEQAAGTTQTGTGDETSPAPVEGGDPREGGFEVALGEWAVTPEAAAIRPGPVTFVIVNRGEMPHGFEIELEDAGGPSGKGSGEDRGKVETRILDPGESVEVELDLTEGLWKLECNVEGHDDLGMETLLEVRADAPLAAAPGRGDGAATVAIEAFAFAPVRIEATAGEEIEWTNHDSADHTVIAEDGGFDSGTMAEGATFRHAFDDPGEYRYLCALHPSMKGVVVVR